jgi:hypothetical protein
VAESSAAIIDWLDELSTESSANRVLVRIASSKPTKGRYSRARLDRHIEWILRERIAAMVIEFGAQGQEFGLTWNQGYYGIPGLAALRLGATFNAGYFLKPDRFIELSQSLAMASGLPVGILSSPALPGELYSTTTQLEQDLHAGGVRFEASLRERYLPGLAWAVWITAGHIAALGGRERIVESAPVARVLQFETGLWLQLTEDPWSISACELNRFAQFVQPIMPSLADLSPRTTHPRQESTSVDPMEPFSMKVLVTLRSDDLIAKGQLIGGQLPSQGALLSVQDRMPAAGRVVHASLVKGQPGMVTVVLVGREVALIEPGDVLIDESR